MRSADARGRPMPRGGWAAVALLAALACQEGSPPTEAVCALPEIEGSEVAANPTNVLSAIVEIRAEQADSIAVRYGRAGLQPDSLTPAVRAGRDAVLVPVLGLLPSQPYTVQAVGFNACGSTLGAPLPFVTDQLPADLPVYQAGGPDPTPGFVAFAAGMYGLVIDNTGRVVWYYRFPSGPGLNFQPQPNGRFVARPNPAPGEPARWIEISPLGEVTRTMGCARSLAARPHDMLALEDGSYWLLCDEARVMDLSPVGGMPDARVTGTVIQHVGAGADLRFEWSPFDHFAITDLDPAERTGANVNWTHGNALALDGNGSLYVSFRNLDEVTRIDIHSGQVVWRMGGRANQFAFADSRVPPFHGQHGLRVVGPGELLLLDNLGEPGESRAERYTVDHPTRTARLVGSYGTRPGVIGELGGTTQALPGNRLLVSFGNGARVEEYDRRGDLVWRIHGNPGYVFRAHRIPSLYAVAR